MASNPHSDDELDRLLGQARWPEPRDEQFARLADGWRRMRRARRRRQIGLGVLATAATVLVIAAVVARRTSQQGPQTIVAVRDRKATEEEPPGEAPPEPPKTVRPATPERWAVEPRDPNVYERVVLIDMMKKGRPTTAAVDEDLVERMIVALGKDAEADVHEGLVALSDNLAQYEPQLAEAAGKGSPQRRLGAARLLSRIGSRRSLPALVESMADPATRDAALVGLGRLASDRELARSAARTRDPDLRSQLLRLLLERGTNEAVALYLGFVNAPAFRDEALDAVDMLDNPPADELLAYLESPQGSLRLAAALALSRVPDAAVVERVCASVLGIGRQEALIALLLNQSEKATGCLNRARNDVYLVASLRAAEQRLNSLQVSRGGHLP